MILSFFYWNQVKQNEKKARTPDKKPVIFSNPGQFHHEPSPIIYQSPSPQWIQTKPQFTNYNNREKAFQPKVTSIDEDPPIDYLQIGINPKRRQKSLTQRWTSEEYRRNRRNQSARMNAAANQQCFSEFDNLDAISDDQADLQFKNLPSNKLFKKMTF